MILVSIEPADIMKFAIFVYFDFIHVSNATTFSFELVVFRFIWSFPKANPSSPNCFCFSIVCFSEVLLNSNTMPLPATTYSFLESFNKMPPPSGHILPFVARGSQGRVKKCRAVTVKSSSMMMRSLFSLSKVALSLILYLDI